MQILGSRRGGLVTLTIAAVALVVVAAFAVWQLVERPSVDPITPAPGASVSDRTPTITVAVPADARLGDLKVTVDGRDATADARSEDGRLAVVTPKRLTEGTHSVSVSFTSSNVFARTVSKSWQFDVDTSAPKLALTAPKQGVLKARRAVAFSGTAEPGTTVTVAAGGTSTDATTGADGAWRMVARLPEGAIDAKVTASDAAGNATTRTRRLTVDTTPPTLAVSAPTAGQKLTETDQPLVYGTVRSDNPRALRYAVRVNGAKVVTVKGSDAATPASLEASYGQAASTPTTLEVDGRRIALAVGTLPQGTNRIAVTATDAAGNATKVTRVVQVNSTDEFGAVDMRPGARGADVTALQKRLRQSRVYPKKAKLTGVYDKTTKKSVARYQTRFDLPVTGTLNARTRQAMVGRIVVNLGQRKLRLIRDGRVWRTYGIAVGQPAHPTPTGEYEVNDKQVDPAWYPPDSPWAAELETIPPGPGNPLGTRWIGTTAPAIGIHGTYADSSIGYAASHGCMRMHIPDVEELFEQVQLGTTVSIRP